VVHHVNIRGLTGTLNTDDVHQTMEARKAALDACIGESRRSLRWISGSIRFAFQVDAQGQVSEVHPTESDIGHGKLERCIGEAVAATVFPAPAGHATARFAWGMTVEPASGRQPEPLDVERLKTLLRKRVPALRKTCEVRRRERFKVTAYVAPGGRVVSAGAVPMPPGAAEKLECVLAEVTAWKMPKVDRHSKVSFLLR
jgi:hypothetical protein